MVVHQPRQFQRSKESLRAARIGGMEKLPGAAHLATLVPADRLESLQSARGGLSEEEAALRLDHYGANEAMAAERHHPVRAFLANFTHTLALLLWFAAGLSFAAGIPELGGAILGVIVINGVFAFLQEHRAEHVVETLMRRVAIQTRVVRDDTEQSIPASALVPGDVVRLSAGDIVPADCVLLRDDNLSIDLSMLTGETLPVERTSLASPEPDSLREVDILCNLPAGSAVLTGSGEAVVYATGPESTIGAIAALMNRVERGESLLERQVADLSRLTAIIAVFAGAVTLSLLSTVSGMSILTALTFGTGVIVALVPEGLLPTLSVSLAIGARRMAERGAAERRLSAVEIIGAATVICTDKTGTLTENRLSVLGFVDPEGSSDPSRQAVLSAALCNDARQINGSYEGDPLDVALARWVTGCGQDVETLRRMHTRLSDFPFDAHRRYMEVTCNLEGEKWSFLKGAPESIFEIAGVREAEPPIARELAAATSRGERVLVLAGASADQRPSVLGLMSFQDPPRPEVPDAVVACRQAGIRIVMLTGDHPATARALAHRIGLDHTIAIYEGEEVDRLTDRALLNALTGDAVVARADPRQKLRIVSLMRTAGEVVVVTGDGINDAPALRAADVGVAMGRRGTEVAKQAADIVLSDDNFATIVAAIEEGRAIKTNIRRFVSYVFTSNVAELAPFLVYVFLPVPLPLAIAQVLAIDLGTDLLPALALGIEPASSQSMGCPPEPPTAPLLTRSLALRTFLFFGLVEAALGLVGFFGYYLAEGWRPFADFDAYSAVHKEAATMTFLGIVAGQIGCLFAQRDGPLAVRLSLRRNSWIAWGLLFEVAVAIALVYVPGLNRLFSMTAVPLAWLLILPLGAAAFILLDVVRREIETGGRGQKQSGSIKLEQRHEDQSADAGQTVSA